MQILDFQRLNYPLYYAPLLFSTVENSVYLPLYITSVGEIRA